MGSLTASEINAALESLPGWVHEDDRLVRSFTFADFKQAMAFITMVGLYAEQMNHHPELTNVYNRVRIALCTHDVSDRVTERDVDLAQRVSGAAERIHE